jgi:ABC-type dipeptide/oligopeptide/nickel transport system ATPase component
MAVTASAPAQAAERTAHLDVAGLNVSYDTPGGVVEAVRDVSFSVDRGECVALVGESGSGKSNICLAIGGFLAADNVRMSCDRMTLGGVSLDRSVRRSLIPRFTPGIAMIFQDAMTSLDPVWTVRSQLHAVLRAADKIPRGKRDEAARQWLARVGLTDTRRVLGARPYELSGGMRQRVMLALALAGNPGLVIADEPTSALDASLSRDVMELMIELTATNGIALLLVTHDIKLCEEYSNRTLVMYRGRLVEEIESPLLTTAARHRYTQGLVGCVPSLEDASRDALPTIGDWLDLDALDAMDLAVPDDIALATADAGSAGDA